MTQMNYGDAASASRSLFHDFTSGGPPARGGRAAMMTITVMLFAAGIAMGIAGALAWAWGVRSGQFRDLEKTKEQLFWPDIAREEGEVTGPDTEPRRRT